ncbi:MAG: hypothetical protein K9N07_07265 [Candidatus Cloacimonetes bacterium]|nr:hypothetical protein [Candidatus Cloacimonadota bacterium]
MENKVIICQVCGNEVPLGAAICPWCENAVKKSRLKNVKGEKFRTVDIKSDQPDIETARSRLSAVLFKAKADRVKVLKIIHGYGSSGKGGDICYMVREYLEAQKYSQVFQYYVKGEEFSSGYQEGLLIAGDFPKLRSDSDWGNRNKGITLVVMR